MLMNRSEYKCEYVAAAIFENYSVMVPKRDIAADPFQTTASSSPPCFACGSTKRKKPSLLVNLSASQVRARAVANTVGYCNPFQSLNPSKEARVNLCTDCRGVSRGWPAISNPRLHGPTAARRALNSWIRRCTPTLKPSLCNVLYARITAHIMPQILPMLVVGALGKGKPTHDWTIFNTMGNQQNVKEFFVAEMSRLAACDMSTIQELCVNPAGYFLCYIHTNHSRIAQERAYQFECSQKHDSNCMFMGKGCTELALTPNKRLWLIKVLEVASLTDLEAF